MEYIVFHTTMNHPSSQIMEKTRKTPKQKKKKIYIREENFTKN